VIFVAVVPGSCFLPRWWRTDFRECLDVRRADQANYGVEIEYDWTEFAFRCRFGDGTSERVGISIAWSIALPSLSKIRG
jgi:hypothetical protein